MPVIANHFLQCFFVLQIDSCIHLSTVSLSHFLTFTIPPAISITLKTYRITKQTTIQLLNT
jgi:hypothetical protein